MERSLSLDRFVRTTLERCLRQMKSVLPFERAGVWLYREDSLSLQSSWPEDKPWPEAEAPLPAESLFSQVASRAEPLLLADAQADGRYRDELGDSRAVAITPLLLDNQVLGVLGLGSRQPAAFSQADLRMLVALGRQIAASVRGVQEYEALQSRYDKLADDYNEAELRAGKSLLTEKDLRQTKEGLESQIQRLFTLHETGKSMQLLREEGAIADYAAQAIVSEMGLERGLVLLLDKPGTHLYCQAYASQQGLAHEEWLIPVKSGLVSEVVATDAPPLFVADAMREPRLEAGFWERFPVTSLVALPLPVEGRAQGVLVAGSQFPYSKLVQEDIGLLSILAVQTGRAIENARLHARTLRRVEEMASLYALGVAIASTLDLDGILHAIRNQLGEVMDNSHFSIAFYDPVKDALDFHLAFVAGEPLRRFRLELAEQEGLEGWVIHRREPLLIEDWESEGGRPAIPARPDRPPLRSWLGVPIMLRDQAAGIMIVQSLQPYAFDKQHLWLLSAVANQAAIAIENARLYTELKRLNVSLERRVQARMADLATVNEISRTVNSTLDLQQVLDHVMSIISESFTVERASLLLLDVASRELAFAMNLGGDLQALQQFHLELGKGIAGWVAQTGETAIVLDPASDPRFFPDVSKSLGFEVKSILCVPLQIKGRSIGVIELLNKVAGDFTREDADRLLTLVPPIAIAIENAQFYGQAQKRAAELQEANVNLIKLNDARIEFVSSVSHELRTPMTAIKGYTDMLLSGMVGKLTEPQLRFISIIKANADRLGILVSDLLEVSRLEAGRIHLKPKVVSADEVIYEAASTLQGQIVAKKLALATNIPANLPPVWGDRDRLIQILTNLLSNACKYTPEGGSIEVTASLRQGEAATDKPSVQIDVADTGIGIAPEEQAKVFQRFFRADHPMVRDQVGTGLGLSIVKGLVELHRGRIWFTSELGKGTTFSFLVPLAAETQPQEAAP